MLDVAVEKLSFHYPGSSFLLHEISLLFSKQTHTIIAGPAGAGKTTLLRLIAGDLRSKSGVIRMGSRVVNDVKKSARPLLHVTSASSHPPRWSVGHVLIAAARQGRNDREDRLREIELAMEKWSLASLADRRCDRLSHSELCRLQLARVEILRPAILLGERILERAAPSEGERLADIFYRALRVIGTTVITEASRYEEQRFADDVVVLHDGAIEQHGSLRTVHDSPSSEAVAISTGDANVIPVTVDGSDVSSPLGGWTLSAPAGFQGAGLALIRPESFSIPEPGEPSDLIFSVEEAGFDRGRWRLQGFITGGTLLRVSLPAGDPIHKGKLIPLRFDPSEIHLLRSSRELAEPSSGGWIPSIAESR